VKKIKLAEVIMNLFLALTVLGRKPDIFNIIELQVQNSKVVSYIVLRRTFHYQDYRICILDL